MYAHCFTRSNGIMARTNFAFPAVFSCAFHCQEGSLIADIHMPSAQSATHAPLPAPLSTPSFSLWTFAAGACCHPSLILNTSGRSSSFVVSFSPSAPSPPALEKLEK
ncbi:hypothetical protein M3J09_010460 [Ascochyta lentis]